MKVLSQVIVIASALTFVGPSVSAYAASKKSQKTASSLEETAPEASSQNATAWGFGFSAWENISNLPGGLTAILKLNDKVLLQPIAGINGTRGGAQFAVGSLIKYKVQDNGSSGLHVGGGATVGSIFTGTKSVFGVGITGLGGFHFSMPGASHIVVHMDGGPQLSIVDGNANFMVKALSAAFGLSVVYML